MKRPLFSCVIPVKGARPYFDEALESLLSQGMGDDLEIIVQDGDVGMGNGERGTGNGEGIPRRPKGGVAEGDALAGVEAVEKALKKLGEPYGYKGAVNNAFDFSAFRRAVEEFVNK